MKKKISMFLCLMCGIVMTGCASGGKSEDIETYIYYLNTKGDILEKREYAIKGKNEEKIVEDMLKELKKSPEDIEVKSAIPNDVKVKSFKIKQRQLSIHFNDVYMKMKKSTEVLCRAAVVQTLTQVDGIDFVSFYVGDEALKDGKGVPIGLMRAEDFVQNTDSSLDSYQMTSLNLYFANKEGDGLVKEKVDDVRYRNNTSVEKLIVEQLMKGPNSDRAKATIPKETKLLGVSVKDGICYVNLDSSFLTEGYNQKAQVPIYSIVNSIIENGNASQVQILIDGASDAVYKGIVRLEAPLEWKAELIEEKKKE